MSIQIAPCWLNFATDIAGGLAIMNRLVIWQTIRALKPLVTLKFFLAASDTPVSGQKKTKYFIKQAR